MADGTEFANPTGINWQGHTGVVQYGGGDQRLVVLFFNKPIHSPAKSTEAGRPVYEDKTYVRIHPPGERLNIVERECTVDDQRRFPMQWGQFQQQKQQIPEGTPIDLLYPEYPSIAAMLRAAGVQTIEQCADLSGHAIDNIGMGAQRYVNEAKKYLEFASKGVKASQLRHELEERDRTIRNLEQKMKMLEDALQEARANVAEAASLDKVQEMIAGAMGRPQHLPGRGFDPQTAMITANHPTRRAAPAPEPRRRRATLKG